ncbi:hypothetical protein ACFE04_022583 [Oxalis oulophora]
MGANVTVLLEGNIDIIILIPTKIEDELVRHEARAEDRTMVVVGKWVDHGWADGAVLIAVGQSSWLGWAGGRGWAGLLVVDGRGRILFGMRSYRSFKEIFGFKVELFTSN